MLEPLKLFEGHHALVLIESLLDLVNLGLAQLHIDETPVVVVLKDLLWDRNLCLALVAAFPLKLARP